MIAAGKLAVEPKVDDGTIREFIQFAEDTCPAEYYDEKFTNTWFFDDDNNLISHEGKFAEPPIWYEHLKSNFFEKRGYVLSGDPYILGEGEEGYEEICKERFEEYKKWIGRLKMLSK